MATQAAPGELELIRSFVNTWDAEIGTDEVATPAELARWLGERRLLDPGKRLSARDRDRAASFRDSLRALVAANSGAPLPKNAVADLNRAASGARLELRFSADGSAELTAAGTGIDASIARLAAVVSRAMDDGTWTRLKICRAGDCEWAFYDRSRNRSATWCDMASCGNRAKVRNYRKRQTARDA
jgi:predicted RNA-binding Zn ribbon-like protein